MWEKCQASTQISHCRNSSKNSIEKIEKKRDKIAIPNTHISLFLGLNQALELKLPRFIKEA